MECDVGGSVLGYDAHHLYNTVLTWQGVVEGVPYHTIGAYTRENLPSYLGRSKTTIFTMKP